MYTTIIRKKTFDYRVAVEMIQKEAIPKNHSWSISYDNKSKDYYITIIKKSEEEKSNDSSKAGTTPE